MKDRVLEAVLAQLADLPLYDQLEVLANVFMRSGVEEMNLYSKTPEVITPENVMETIIHHKEKHGETLGAALALQGITLLAWLEDVR